MSPRNVHTLGGGNSRPSSSGSQDASNPSIKMIWGSIAPVTRAIALMLCLNSVLFNLQIVSFGQILFQWNETYKHFQLWRAVTSCMILPPKAMYAVMELYNIFSRSSQLENEHFFITSLTKPSVDYTFYICCCIFFITNAVALIFGPMVVVNLTGAFSSCLTFTWAVDNANNKVLFYGLIPVYGKYYPLLMLLISVIFGEENFFLLILGMFTAYIFLCLDTRSFGPIWGFIMRKQASYGRAPGGKFGAPNWFISLYDLIFRTHTQRSPQSSSFNPVSNLFKSGFQGTGSRLGGDGAKKNPRGGSRLGSRDTSKATSTGTSSSVGTGSFRGEGQRLGGKKE